MYGAIPGVSKAPSEVRRGHHKVLPRVLLRRLRPRNEYPRGQHEHNTRGDSTGSMVIANPVPKA